MLFLFGTILFITTNRHRLIYWRLLLLLSELFNLVHANKAVRNFSPRQINLIIQQLYSGNSSLTIKKDYKIIQNTVCILLDMLIKFSFNKKTFLITVNSPDTQQSSNNHYNKT